MSKYTTEVRYICEHYAGYDESQGYGKVNEIIEQSKAKVFDFSFPIYDENYRGVLETKILKHYYTREIGLETVGLWKHFLDMKLNEIMPYYNQLYKSAMLEFNPFYDVDLTRDHTGSDAGKSDNVGTSNTTNQNDRWDYYSDTPQGSVSRLDNLTYLTTAENITDNGSGTGRTTSNTTMSSTNEYLEHIVGKQGTASYSRMLMEFRDTMLNIDMLIINELAPLFMNLW